MNKGLCILLMICSGVAHASQQCQSNVITFTPDNDFEFLAGGEVRHKVTGLQWKRCYSGYDFNDNGSPSNYSDDFCTDNFSVANVYTWQAALNLASSGWRLPNIKELQSIVEYSCRLPARKITVFPAIPTPPSSQPEITWSSTPAAKFDNRAWSIGAAEGAMELGVSSNSGASRFYVRLVK